MLENPTVDPSAAAAAANVASVKLYAPPNQRNRALGRRKSGGDQLERANSYTNAGEKAHISYPRNVPIINHGDEGSINHLDENPFVGLIPLHECCNTKVLQLLNDRWSAAMNAFNSLPEDSCERPVLYSRRPWGHAILPHQLMPAAASSGLKKDFLSELRHAVRSVNASSDILKDVE